MERSDFMVLDEDTKILITKNKPIKLRKNEYLLLYFLIKKRYQICYKKDIIMYIFNCTEEDAKYWSSTLSQILTNLRKKIKETNIDIQSVYGIGYILRYILDQNEKKHIKNLEIKEKINNLKEEIKEKERKIKILEEQLNER